jgi:hypothetical protein
MGFRDPILPPPCIPSRKEVLYVSLSLNRFASIFAATASMVPGAGIRRFRI